MIDAASDREFARVREGSFVSYPCSPPIPRDRGFRGVLVRAPARVVFGAGDAAELRSGAFARMIVCGAFRLEETYLDAPSLLERILLVAVDAATHRAFAGTMTIIPNRIPEPSPPARRAITQFFNPNLAQILGLPRGEADYIVYATLGEYVSNVVRIELRRAEGEE